MIQWIKENPAFALFGAVVVFVVVITLLVVIL